ncbi:MAG: SPOR domain-containing protein [Nanoarchaeota archaeon]|nr:SPOR domain-containing protein [Nanoarchaeota archaeon]
MNGKSVFKKSFKWIFFLILLISIIFLCTRQLRIWRAKQVVEPTTPQQKPFTIQVASFQDSMKAEKVVEELEKAEFSAIVSAKHLDEKGVWYRVYVGDFDSEEEASGLLNTLKKDYKDSFIKLR